MKYVRRLAPIGAVLALVVIVAGCQKNSNTADAKLANRQLGQFQVNQPAPSFPWSQLRQNLIEIETAQSNVTNTTSFFFNLGVSDPVMTCPSIGMPIPTTDEITNPQTRVPNHDAVVSQIDPNGIYSGQSSGTYVICVNAAGKAYATYWEGDVFAVTGAVAWDYGKHQMSPVGTPTAEFSVGKK